MEVRKVRGDWTRNLRKGKVRGNLFEAFEAVLCNYRDVLEKKESERYNDEGEDLMENEREDPRHAMIGYNFNEKEDFTFEELEELEDSNFAAQ